MYGLLALIILGVVLVMHQQSVDDVAAERNLKFGDKLEKLWSVAQESLREKKYLRAEKALLTILRVDERNATAYNRLGILYAKQQAFNDAIECFEIAQSLEPSASSLHNVGLIYLEVGKLDKAALAFEQAISMEDGIPSRYVAYAKVQEKLGNNKKMLSSLEYAVELERNPQSLRILADAYDRLGFEDKAKDLRDEVVTVLQPKQKAAQSAIAKRIRQPRKVM
jgi:tetratricopeptide (TPR) repeat protein